MKITKNIIIRKIIGIPVIGAFLAFFVDIFEIIFLVCGFLGLLALIHVYPYFYINNICIINGGHTTFTIIALIYMVFWNLIIFVGMFIFGSEYDGFETDYSYRDNHWFRHWRGHNVLGWFTMHINIPVIALYELFRFVFRYAKKRQEEIIKKIDELILIEQKEKEKKNNKKGNLSKVGQNESN